MSYELNNPRMILDGKFSFIGGHHPDIYPPPRGTMFTVGWVNSRGNNALVIWTSVTGRECTAMVRVRVIEYEIFELEKEAEELIATTLEFVFTCVMCGHIFSASYRHCPQCAVENKKFDPDEFISAFDCSLDDLRDHLCNKGHPLEARLQYTDADSKFCEHCGEQLPNISDST